MQQRYYDSVIGRFYSNDPVDTVGHLYGTNGTYGFNRYAYANNNPYKFTDPDGRSSYNPQGMAATLQPLSTAQKIAGVRMVVSASPAGRGAQIAKAIIGAVLNEASNDDGNGADNGATESGSNAGGLPKPPTGPGSVPKEQRDPKRAFTPKEREAKREEQGNKCANNCGADIDESNSAGHHIQRHADGGPTTPENHAEVCTECHKDLHSGGN